MRNSNFPWAPLPRRMTPKPMPSWIAPKKISSLVPAVSVPRNGSIPPDSKHARSQAPLAPAEADLAPISSHHTQINVFEEDSPELETLRQQNAQLEETLSEAIAENARMRKNLLEASEKELVMLSIAIAERAVDQELKAAPQMIVEWAKQAIDMLTEDEVTIALSPEVEPLLAPEKWAGFFPTAIVVVDQTLRPGHTQVRTKSTRIGVGKADRITAIIEALGEIAK
ncbi:MAG: FliH/SctL family protein [Polyangiaceae bacterium]